MTLLGTHYKLDELGDGRFRHTQFLRPVNYLANGVYQPINSNWQDSGDGTFPHVVTAAPMLFSSGPTGARRIHPTRELDVYIEVGRIWHIPAATWLQAPMNALTRNGNRLLSINANYNLVIDVGGHFLKFGLVAKNNFWPANNTIAFPASLVGLTRTGSILYKNGVPVCQLRPPIVYDLNDESKTLPIGISFGQFGTQSGVIFNLPSPAQLVTAGITAPVIDPTVSLQPDATAGIDAQIFNVSPNNNLGASTFLFVGERNDSADIRRSLIKFDLSTVPSGATISAATLSLYANLDLSSNARTFRVFRQKRGWLEGTGNNSATGDGATWNTYDGINNWQTAGGFGANDCEQTDIGSRAFTATETLSTFKDFTLAPTTKAALDLGNGWLVKADTETDDAYRFDSSDSTTAANRPKLVIEYSLPTGGRRLFSPAFPGIFG